MTYHIAKLTPNSENVKSISIKPFIDILNEGELKDLKKNYTIVLLKQFSSFNEAIKEVKQFEKQTN